MSTVMIARRALWAVVTISVVLILTLAFARQLDDAQVVAAPPLLPETPPAGSFMYLHVEGPFLLAWDTRTGQTKLCMIQQSGVNCR